MSLGATRTTLPPSPSPHPLAPPTRRAPPAPRAGNMATPTLQSSFALTCKLRSRRGGWRWRWGLGHMGVMQGRGREGGRLLFPPRPSPPEDLIVNTREVNIVTGFSLVSHAGENPVCRWQILWDPQRGELGRSDII